MIGALPPGIPTPILIAHNLSARALAALTTDGWQFRVVSSRDLATALDDWPKTEILYTLRLPTPWKGRWGIRWAQLHTAGVDHVRLSELPTALRITTASGVHAVSMAEHAVGMIIILERRFKRFFQFQREGNWAHESGQRMGFDLLRGKTIGILGYGSIGREIGRLASALGMTVLAAKHDLGTRADRGFWIAGTGDPEGTIPTSLYSTNGLDGLLRQSDVVVNVLPLTESTRNLMNDRTFGLMHFGAMFINLGRGQTVDELALTQALESGRLGGAALDVTASEPLPKTSPLWQMDNVIITPHVGAAFNLNDDMSVGLFCDNLRRYARGEQLLNEVDRSRGY